MTVVSGGAGGTGGAEVTVTNYPVTPGETLTFYVGDGLYNGDCYGGGSTGPAGTTTYATYSNGGTPSINTSEGRKGGDGHITFTFNAMPPDPIAPTPVPALGAFCLMGLAGATDAVGVAMNRRRKHN